MSDNLFKKKKKNVTKIKSVNWNKKICEIIGLLYLHTGYVRLMQNSAVVGTRRFVVHISIILVKLNVGLGVRYYSCDNFNNSIFCIYLIK